MELTGFSLAASSTVQVGESFSMGFKALCTPYEVGGACFNGSVPTLRGRYNLSPRGISYLDNVVPQGKGRVRIEGGDGYQGPSDLRLEELRGPYLNDKRPVTRLTGIRYTQPGVTFITVVHDDTGIQATSNPIVVSAEPLKERLFWGDIHSQTFFSDGLRCPEELYAFARDEAFLDIFGLADHSESLSDRQWDYFTAVTNDYNEAGRFATILGLEWTNSQLGHRNIHYPGSTGPILRSNDRRFSRLEDLFAAARDHGALAIPHHSANVTMGVDWSLGHDPEAERLVEIHSVWGTSERPESAGNRRPIRSLGGEKPGQHVIDALRLGRRYGFVGGGDTHDGRPGDELHSLQKEPADYGVLSRQGIMGVWAGELTRQAVFDALWNRRVYATSNVRTYLTFHVCGAFMGSEVRHSGPRSIRVHAISEVPFARAEIVRNGDDLLRLEPHEREIRWETEDEGTGGSDWYYVRLTREDGENAWSSPVWVSGKA
jgi:hypothetical protein